MRRIPRPSRAIDPSVPLHSTLRPRIVASSCHPAVPQCTLIRTSTAAFSSTTSNHFLLPAKQDKKKHQQFVRRWQKRLLGDSEPIGARVDPYDPTSPIRIATEERGEYEEVLEEDSSERDSEAKLKGIKAGSYVPVDTTGEVRSGDALLHVGGEKWLQRKVEIEMAQEFEKLTLRTYTPMSLEMADDIEQMTGTPYTLRDGDLYRAQMTHKFTARPYTSYNFGLQRRHASPQDLRMRFAQAVAEVYTLKEAGLDMDVSKLPNQGIYYCPEWIKNVKLCKTASGELALVYPEHRSAEELLELMQSRGASKQCAALDGEDVLVEEAEYLLDPVLPAEAVPTMDPVIPEFKRAAVVKIDAEKKPFDFMSNRPVPRAKPVETEKVEAVLEVEEAVAEAAVAPSPHLAELQPALETSQSAVSELQKAVMKQRKASKTKIPRTASRQDPPTPSNTQGDEIKWRHAPITSDAIKFALFKRVYQLTSIRISDAHVSSSRTIGELYDHVCEAAKLQPTSLYKGIMMEGRRARWQAKRQPTPASSRRQRRADLGDLISLGNVKLRATKPTKTELQTKTGLQKLINRALDEADLRYSRRDARDERRDQPLRDSLGLVEGNQRVPHFGKPLSSRSVNHLKSRLEENRGGAQADYERARKEWGVKLPDA
ncbi:Actin-related protein 6 [Pleosporales sp. CAS-2024a]